MQLWTYNNLVAFFGRHINLLMLQ